MNRLAIRCGPLNTFQCYLCIFNSLKILIQRDRICRVEEQKQLLAELLNNNRSATRPLLDNHSVPICLVLCFLISNSCLEEAKVFIRNLIQSLVLAHNVQKRLPDGRNQLESVIRYIVASDKSIYYEDKTSHLFGVLAEFIAILDMDPEYKILQTFVKKTELDLAVFVPYSDTQLLHALPENKKSHELNFVDHQLHEEGYQSEILLSETFAEFKQKTLAKNEFFYKYRTMACGLKSILLLAHVFFKTPLFSHFWRPIEEKATFGE